MEFDERVYSLLNSVPKGKVTTYREIANALGMKGFRAVGQALKRNSHAPAIPCHRVVMSDGSLGGYGGLSKKGAEKKRKLLESEGVEIKEGRIDIERYLHRF